MFFLKKIANFRRKFPVTFQHSITNNLIQQQLPRELRPIYAIKKIKFHFSIFYPNRFFIQSIFILNFYHHQTLFILRVYASISIFIIFGFLLKCLFITCVIAFFVSKFIIKKKKKLYVSDDDGWHLRETGWVTLFLNFSSFALHRQTEQKKIFRFLKFMSFLSQRTDSIQQQKTYCFPRLSTRILLPNVKCVFFF